jgi:acyl-CoA dehydrogenase
VSAAEAGTELTGGLLGQTLERLFEATSGPEDRQAAEAVGWADRCWDALADAGLAWVGVPESAGGSGGTVIDACTLARMAGRHAVPLPVAECALLGGWTIAAAGLRLPAGPVTVAVPSPGDHLDVDRHGRVTGRLHRVPWGGQVNAVVALADSPDGPRVVLIDPAAAEVGRGRNVAGEPRDALTLDGVAVGDDGIGVPEQDLGPELALRGALSRALLMAGAMESASDLTVDYAGQRRQFGKAIGSFQAVAQRLVRLSSETEVAALSVEVAALRFAQAGVGAGFEIDAARAVASRAASEVAAHAHQVHGAIGMTQEYRLHHFTRRLWAWRQEWGSQRRSAAAVGRRAVEAGAAGLWPLVTTGLVEAQ